MHRVLSPPLSNAMGVFQGSALGPLLFTIFANNLSLYAGDAELFQYANGTQVLVSGPAREIRKLPDVRVSFHDAALQPCAQVGTLASLSTALCHGTPDAHVSELYCRCTGLLIGLFHARHCLPDGIIRMLVTALVVSRIQYCLSAYVLW